jgi:DHA1 family multidrug resistance protein-like MFS transporter
MFAPPRPLDMTNRRNLAILFLTLVVVMLGFGIIIPILPFYVEAFGGGGFEMGMLMSIFSLMQLVFSPLWGALSDRVGRKPLLMVGTMGTAIGMVGLAYAPAYAGLFAARMFMGIVGSATLPSGLAYISDSTDERDRGGGMGMWGAAFGLGMMLGPGIGGALSAISLQAPFLFAAGAALLATLLIWWILPESLPHELRSTATQGRAGFQPRQLAAALSGPIGFLLVLAFLQNFALANFEGMYAFYAQRRYEFNPPTIGLIIALVGGVGAAVQGVLTGPATRSYGDGRVIKASLAASVFGFLAMVLAPNLAWVLVTTGFFVLSVSMLRPGVASLTSKRTTLAQGATMGLSNAAMSLGRIVGPLWAGVAMDLDIHLPFLGGAGVMLIAFVATMHFLPQEGPLPHDAGKAVAD